MGDTTSGGMGWSERAYEILKEWLRSHDVHDTSGFEELCRQHPDDVAQQLRANRRGIVEAEQRLGRHGAYERHVVERLGRQMSNARESRHARPVTADDLRELAARDELDRRYDVIGPVDAGGMGIVYRAWDRDLQRDVALKVLRLPNEEPRFPDDGPFDEELAGREDTLRFVKEAHVTAALRHPGVASVHTVGADKSGRPFFAMELLQGDGFDDVIEWIHEGRPGWTTNRALRIIRTICEATAYAHQVGVMHRDIKPANVLVGSLGATYVLDWGLHKSLGDASSGDGGEREITQVAGFESQGGDLKGSVPYMSPEHALGREVDERSDIYSLGAILYHLLTGRPPYFPQEGPALPPVVLRLLKKGPPPSIVDVVEGAPVPEALVEICQRAMERDVERRYANAGQMATELGEYLEDVSEDRVEARRQANRAQHAIQWVTTVLSYRDPDEAQGKDITVADALDRAEKLMRRSTHVDPVDEASLHLMIGRLYLDLGKLDRADTHLRTAFEVYQLELGHEHRETLATAFELGRLLREQTRFDEAEERLRKTWRRQVRSLGDWDPDTRRTARVLASLLVTAGKFDEGVMLSERVVDSYRRTLGARHEDTLAAMRDLCVALGKTGQRTRAIDMLRGVLSGLEESRGERHTETIYARAELGSHLMGGPEAADVSAEELSEAERHVQRALKDASVVCGEDHPATLVIRQNLAQLRERQGEYEEASQLYADVLRTLRGQKREGGRLGIFARAGLGRVLLRLGAGRSDAPLAETLLQDAAQLADGSLRAGEAGRCWTFLGDAMVRLERWQEAAAAFENALARLEQEPAEARAWRRAGEALADVYEHLDRHDDATRVRRRLDGGAGRSPADAG